jgi:mannose-6-phosphate isomerase-like protein (cupin superfamily)
MLIEALNDELISYTRYENNQIIYIDKEGKDYKVKDEITFSNWVKNYKSIPHIKVEGLEDNNYHLQLLKDYDLNFKMKNAHLFYNQLGGFSFPEHTDDINVLLCVIKGSKKVFIENYPIIVNEGQSISIPKGAKHKVESLPFTWALSIGYK